MEEGHDYPRALAERLERSPFARLLAGVRSDGGDEYAFGGESLRRLNPDEIAQLAANGCWSSGWERVRVAEGFQSSLVRGSELHGDISLGRFSQNEGLPGGIYRSTLVNCRVGHNASIRDVGLLRNAVIGPGASLRSCGTIACNGETAYGNGRKITVGPETGGRSFLAFAEMLLDDASVQVGSEVIEEVLEVARRAIAAHVHRLRASFVFIGALASVHATPTILNSVIGPGAIIDGAQLIESCTILSELDEPTHVKTGAVARSSILQWGTIAQTQASMDQSVLLEHSHAEGSCRITSSLLGPNSGVAGGEATCSLIGPFVSFHHQALLIGTVWPEGKGNIAYGANIGSNHTGKAPDQEFFPGEGAFLGLGTCIKFPADYRCAPYCLVASGVTTLPQRVEMPFSLINAPSQSVAGLSPAINEIFPGWVLRENAFALRRSEGKFQARNRAKRHQFEFAVFRPDTIRLVRIAYQRLGSVKLEKEIYLEADIPGLGKSFCTETARQHGLEAYRFCLKMFDLENLLEQVRNAPTKVAHKVWDEQAETLSQKYQVHSLKESLEAVREMVLQTAANVERSKARDDERGSRIQPDYARSHRPAGEDAFVIATWSWARDRVREIEEVLTRLS